MADHRFTELQKTPWFSLDQPPSRPGYYELRERRTHAEFSGRYEKGRWFVAYRDTEYTRLAMPYDLLEWRGLLEEPLVMHSTMPSIYTITTRTGFDGTVK